MAVREKRNARLSQIKTVFDMHVQGLIDLEMAKKHIQFGKENNGVMIFASEYPKFAEEYAEDIASGKFTLEQFQKFCVETGALKKANSKKKASGDPSTSRGRLNTAEAAVERGVAPENIDAYLQLVETIYTHTKALNALVTKARVSFAIPVIKEEPEAEEAEGTESTEEVSS